MIRIRNISIFRHFDEQSLKTIEGVFELVVFQRNEVLFKFGEEVPGLYILQQGEVQVLNEQMDTQLAVLGEGSSIGEMSLIEQGQRSSANLRSLSDTTKGLFCKRETFLAFLRQDPQHELAFYKGASSTLAERLRQTNQKITFDLDKAQALIEKVADESKVLGYIGTTREGINSTGSHILQELRKILPLLEKISQEEGPEAQSLREAVASIRQLSSIESQNIDRFSQQLDMIGQYFSNMRRILRGERPKEIEGDKNIFSKPEQESSVEFF